jgi:hypothetical protein
MAQSKFTIYKYVKLKNGSWRYCRATFYSNGKIKPNRCIVGGKEEEHPEGACYLYHKKRWILVGSDAFEAQRQRNARLDADESQRLRGTAPAPSPTMQPTFDRLTLSAAAEKYFSNCEKRGLDSKTIRKHRAAVEPFIQHCGVIYADECRENKQPLFDMGWLRERPVPTRKHRNPERTTRPTSSSIRRSSLGSTSPQPPHATSACFCGMRPPHRAPLENSLHSTARFTHRRSMRSHSLASLMPSFEARWSIAQRKR